MCQACAPQAACQGPGLVLALEIGQTDRGRIQGTGLARNAPFLSPQFRGFGPEVRQGAGFYARLPAPTACVDVLNFIFKNYQLTETT